MYHTLFFDLDNTLYPSDSGLWEIIGNRIDTYVKNFVGMEEEKIPEFRQYCRDNFGTTLQGLKTLYKVDNDHYLKYVHDIDLSLALDKNKALVDMLASFPQRKIIFTNSDEMHTRNVLRFLEIETFFDEIVDVIKMAPYAKPQKESYLRALEITNIQSANGCVFIDDLLCNVIGGEEAGFFSILVEKNNDNDIDFPRQINNILQLPEILDKYSQ